MRLTELIEGIVALPRRANGVPDVAVRDVVDDSRQVITGALFIARGAMDETRRGHIHDAIQRGAAAVLSEPVVENDPDTKEFVRFMQAWGGPWVTADRVDQALAGCVAERFWDYPSTKLKLVGITGTNGKTTTAYILRHLLRYAGWRTGLIGTIEIDDGSASPRPASLTTPGAVELSRLLAAMVRHGCQAAVAEVSSHALDQGRAAALDFDAAIFTNLTGDHLDYHGTMDAYAAAKAKLFEQLGPEGWAIVNADDPYGQRMMHTTRGKKVWTSISDTNERLASDAQRPPRDALDVTWQAQILNLLADSSQVTLNGMERDINVRLPLIGRHNVANALGAVAAAVALTDMGETDLTAALACCPAAPGRLEVVRVPDRGEGTPHAEPGEPGDAARHPLNDPPRLPTVVVDYAHTDDALKNVLGALRPIMPPGAGGRLIALIGCGGDRDKTKRPRMAKVACELADIVYLTSDNPRTEYPQAIIADMLMGVPEAKRDGVRVIVDRGEAIKQCIADAGAADTVLLAGKGHEDYQIIGTTKRHFDDREQAAEALGRK